MERDYFERLMRNQHISRVARGLLSSDAFPGMIAILSLFIFLGIYEPRFFRTSNLINVLRNSSFLIIVSIGQMLVLTVGGFDLSVGAIIALTSVITALSMIQIAAFLPEQLLVAVVAGVLAGLTIGLVVGLINGLCVSLLKVSPFIVTLGTMLIASGVALFLTSGIPVYGMPETFSPGFGSLRWLGLPISVYITAFIVGTLWAVFNWTKIGRYIYATGGNINAARVSGIHVEKYTVLAYVLCGLFAALTGVMLTARVGSGEANMGAEFIMESITAAVIGGVSLGGGVGRVEFVTMGAIFLSLIANGMNLLRVDSKIQTIVIGIILIIAIFIDGLRKGRLKL
jgi:ribose transport system permease protein